MDIHGMKRAAKLAARKNGTGHGTELNNIAQAQGFTHWGALIAAQPRPSFGYRYHPMEKTNAYDLDAARRDGNHIVYVADDIEVAIGYVINMANTACKLMPKDIAQAKGFIAKPDHMTVLGDDLTRNWGDMPRISSEEISRSTKGNVIFVEHMAAEHIAAAPKGVTLIGAGVSGGAANWNEDTLARLQTRVIPMQDNSQIKKLYSKEDQAIIYATTAIKYLQPQNDAETIKLIQDMVGPTTIKRKASDRDRSVPEPQGLMYPGRR